MFDAIGDFFQKGVDLIEDYFPDVRPVQGSVVYCDLFLGVIEHTGIYIGANRIIHLAGNGKIEMVSPREFMSGTSALNIYVSCHDSCAVGNRRVSERAVMQMGTQRNYNFILENCHQFTSGCLTGDFQTSDTLLRFVKQNACQQLNANSWRKWKIDCKD